MVDHTRVASWAIKVDGDDADISTFLAGLKGKFQATLNEIQRASAQTDLFATLSDKVKGASDALTKAQQDVKTFTAALAAAKDAGKDVTSDLQTKLVAAQQTLKSTTAEFNKQVDAVSKLENQLTKAGVDTNNLTAAQIKLAAALAETTAAAKLHDAQQALGLVTTKAIQPEIARLNAAFATLQAGYKTGSVSASELAAGQTLLQTKLAAVRGEVNATEQSFGQAALGAKSFLSENLTAILGVVGGVSALTAAYKAVIEASTDYQQRQAEIATVTNLSKQEIAGLAQGVRELAIDLGINAQDALRGLYELLRSGVPADNALEVLKLSAEAAKGALASTADGVKAANVLVSGLKIPVTELGGAFDVLARAQHDGGATLTEFANNAGPLANVARAAGVSLNDLVAVLTVMTNATGDASGSIADLQKLIVKLGDPTVRAQLHGLGIETGNLVQTLTQIGEKGLALNQVIDLGVASAKSAAGIAALTNNTGALSTELERMGTAAGESKSNLDKLADTPKEKFDKLKSALADFSVTAGETATRNSVLVTVVTGLFNLFNRLPDSVKQVDGSARSLALVTVSLAANFLGLVPAAEAATKSTTAYGEAAVETAKKLSDLDIKIANATRDLGAAGDALLSDVKALQDAAAQQIATAVKIADEQVAQLDRSVAASADTARQTAAIQTQLAETRLKIITDNETAIAKVTDEAIAAREAALRKTTTNETQIQAELAKTRLAAIQPTIAAYQALYDTLIGQSQSYQQKEQALQQSRLAFNESVEKTLFDLRIGGLSSFDQYLAKVKEIDRLISLEREAAANADSANAQKYANEAIELAKSLGVAYSVTGAEIISKAQALATTVGKIKEAQDGVNTSFDNADDAARSGYVLTQVYISRVQLALNDLLATQKDLNEQAARGINYKISVDENTYTTAKNLLDSLAAERTAVIKVQVDQTNVGNVTGGIGGVGTFARGGHVMKAIQGFAAGGPIFRAPSWNKVPGHGAGDTVPALLREGSFVVRKAASQYYGDGVMGKLARGFAGGGAVQNFATGGHVDVDPGSAEKDPRFLIPYAQAVLLALGNSAGAQHIFGLVVEDLKLRMQYVSRHPKDTLAIEAMAREANIIGDNLHLVDYWERTSSPGRARKDFTFADFIEAINSGAIGYPQALQAFARGGNVGGDTVPAMLTPGEYVINPQAVRMFGGGLLEAMNKMQVPRGIMADFAPPQPRRYADGGYVDGPGAPMLSSDVKAGGKIELHFHADKLDAEEVRRTVIPELNKILRTQR